MARIRRIVYASDFSPASRAAFAKALELAKSFRAELLGVHVLAPVVPVVGEGYISPSTYQQMEASARAWARKRLAALVARAQGRGAGQGRAPGGRGPRADRARGAGAAR